MNIAQIKQLDDGISGLKCEGSVGIIKEAEHKVGSKNGRDYDFWSQFITVKDTSETIGVSHTGTQSEMLSPNLHKDMPVKVFDAKLVEYKNKEGKMVKKLSGKLDFGQITAQDTSKSPQNAPQSTKNGQDVDWDAKDLRNARMNALNNATNLLVCLAETAGKNQVDSEAVKILANDFVDYIYGNSFDQFSQDNPVEEDDGQPY